MIKGVTKEIGVWVRSTMIHHEIHRIILTYLQHQLSCGEKQYHNQLNIKQKIPLNILTVNKNGIAIACPGYNTVRRASFLESQL